MREIKFSADRLVAALLNLSKSEQLCLLDGGGVSHPASHLLIAGIRPLEVLEITNDDAVKTLDIFDKKTSNPNVACIFTVSYDFGLKLQKIAPRTKEFSTFSEPDIFLAAFDCLIIHDYDTARTYLTGDEKRCAEINTLLSANVGVIEDRCREKSVVSSNFTREEYIATVVKIQESIRRGDTYQTNLTQQIGVRLPKNLTPEMIFQRLRKDNPAAFAAFIKRESDHVISASPERLVKFRIADSALRNPNLKSRIAASPIKGTRPRGRTAAEDLHLQNDLLNSAKDRAENVMIVDLLRNDLGVICEFGSIAVEQLCDLETHPTLFHLVSTISGELRENVKFSDVLQAVFPCGSITGAPKISTMRIIDELETADRGLSMGAIGYAIPNSEFQIPDSSLKSRNPQSAIRDFDLSVAIRTMVVNDRDATFNVGGGITIDSDPAGEYAETLVKARALLAAVNGELK